MTFSPETYGAVGDGTTDDTCALQAWLDAAAAAHSGVLTGPVLRATEGKRYKFTAGLRYVPVGAHGRFLLDGTGAEFVYVGAAAEEAALRIGEIGHKTMQAEIRNLRLTQDSGAGGGVKADSLLHLLHGDFTTVHNSLLSGGAVPLKIGDVGTSTNGISLYDVHTAGGEVGAEIRGSVFQWRGGKIQQASVCGIRLVGGTRMDLDALDLSLNRDAIQLDGCGPVRVACYFERNGTAQAGDESAIVRAVNCHNLEIASYLNASNGQGSNQNAGYCLHLTACDGVRVTCGGQRPQRAFVFADAATRRVTIEPTCMVAHVVNVTSYGPIIDESGEAIVSAPDGHRDVAGTSIAPPVASWTLNHGATWAGNVLELPTGLSSAISAAVSPHAGKVLVRFRARLAQFRQAQGDRTADMALVRILWIQPNNVLESNHRIGERWETFELLVPASNGAAATAYLQVRVDPIDIEVESAEVLELL